MKRKEVEDVMGGKDAWANVDKMDGMRTFYSLFGRGVVWCGVMFLAVDTCKSGWMVGALYGEEEMVGKQRCVFIFKRLNYAD